MANIHFGNLADVFKHVALAEVLACHRPAEYWESHAGRAVYDESDPIAPERLHGVHTFWQAARQTPELRQSHYGRTVAQLAAGDHLSRIPGSPFIARKVLTGEPRRLLFCDTDAASLLNIRETFSSTGDRPKELHTDKIECVQEDGVSVLRGAGVLLPDPWIASTVAFLDPYIIHQPTDAGISPLELACELGNRGIPTLLFYAFADDAQRVLQHERFTLALEKSRLLKRGGCFFEGSLKAAPASDLPTQWGFGLLTLHLKAEATAAVAAQLSRLESAYEKTDLSTAQGHITGAWRFTRAAI